MKRRDEDTLRQLLLIASSLTNMTRDSSKQETAAAAVPAQICVTQNNFKSKPPIKLDLVQKLHNIFISRFGARLTRSFPLVARSCSH